LSFIKFTEPFHEKVPELTFDPGYIAQFFLFKEPHKLQERVIRLRLGLKSKVYDGFDDPFSVDIDVIGLKELTDLGEIREESDVEVGLIVQKDVLHFLDHLL
jgi:hypothetical protein